MPRELPAQPNLEHLQKQAKRLLRELQQHNPTDPPQLADAQHAIAREYGFATWAKLKVHVESLTRPLDPFEELTEAVKSNDAEWVRQLFEKHSELKSKIDNALPNYGRGDTALIAATQRSSRPMIDVLLGAGADINARGDWWAGGFGVLDECAADLVPFLIARGAIVDAHAAARLGMLEKLQELVSANSEVVQARGANGQTLLHFAPTIEIARYLLEHGAQIDARDLQHESTPAQHMLRVGQARHYPRDRQEVARYLVARGCHTDILMAAALGDLDLVRRHLDADPACILTTVSEQYFPKQDPRSAGSVYFWMLGRNRTAHQVARDFGREDIFRLLMESSPAELKLAQACELGDETTFKDLLASRPNLVETLSDDERLRLVNAAQNNNTGAVRLMLGAGWPVDVRGEYGGTPLHWAAWHGNAEMAREILRYDPPLEWKDPSYDLTPLGWCLHGSENGWHRDTGDYAATAEALLQAGAEAPPVTDGLEASQPVRAVLRRYAGPARFAS